MKTPRYQDEICAGGTEGINWPRRRGAAEGMFTKNSSQHHSFVLFTSYDNSVDQVNRMYLLSLSFTTHRQRPPAERLGASAVDRTPQNCCRSLQKVHVDVMKLPHLSLRIAL